MRGTVAKRLRKVAHAVAYHATKGDSLVTPKAFVKLRDRIYKRAKKLHMR